LISPPSSRQALLWAAVAIVLLAALLALGPVLAPFVAGAILAYILAPPVERLQRRGLPRVVAVIAVMTLAFAVLVGFALLLVPIVQKETALIRLRLPDLLASLSSDYLPRLEALLGVPLRLDAAAVREWATQALADSGEAVAVALFGYVRTGWAATVQVLGVALLVPVVLFYLLLDWPRLLAELRALLPLRWRAQTLDALHEIDTLLGQYLHGQLLVMGALAAFYSIGLAIAGFDLWLPIGVVSGALAFVPYLGFAFAALLALVSGMLQLGPLYGAVAVAIVYGLGQLLESLFLTPVLVGERIGLHPLAVILALLAFGYLFGFVGVLLALPMAAAVAVGLRRLRRAYLASELHRQPQ